MEFLYQIYTRSPISVKVSKTRQSPAEKAIKTLKASNANACETSVHLMDKTDILLADSERFSFWRRVPPLFCPIPAFFSAPD